MSKYILVFLVANGISTLVFLKYIYNKFTEMHGTDLKEEKINWLINKVSYLDHEVNDLHEIINNLETQNENNMNNIIDVKKELQREKIILNEKLAFFTKTTTYDYDIIENDSSSDSKIFSTLEFNKSQYEI